MFVDILFLCTLSFLFCLFLLSYHSSSMCFYFFLSFTKCTIFIGGTITTIASFFIYQCIRYNIYGKTTFGLYGGRLSLTIYMATFYLLFVYLLLCTVYGKYIYHAIPYHFLARKARLFATELYRSSTKL